MKRETNSPRVPVTIEIVLGDVPLRSREAAKVLAMSPDTLRDWRYSKPLVGPPFIRIGRSVRYRLVDLLEYLDKRTVRPERSAPFYRRTRIEELGLKHPGLCEFVEEELRRRVSQPRIVAAVQERWGERISTQRLSNFYIARVWPKICNVQRSQVLSRQARGVLTSMDPPSWTI